MSFSRDPDVQKAIDQMDGDLEWQKDAIEMLEARLGRAIKRTDFKHFEWNPEKKGFAVAIGSPLEAEVLRQHDKL